jgi:hypothetical protein
MREVPIIGKTVVTGILPLHLDHRLLGVAPGTVGIDFRGKVGF